LSHPVIPLSVGHLEQINLWNGTCNVEQGVDPAEAFEDFLHDDARRLRFAQVECENNCFGPNRPNLGCRAFQTFLISRCKHNDREVSR
jgi:hypothetical protein